MNQQRGRDLLKKSIHLATTCRDCKDPDLEQRLWKMACNYVKRAQEFLPEEQREHLTAIECQILESGVPHPMQLTFYSDNENQQFIDQPPVPSSWEKIHDLKQQIRSLESEQRKLEEYKHAALALKEECAYLERTHENYKRKSTEEQSQLQQEMKRMVQEAEVSADLKQDAYYMEREMNRLRERFASISTNNREEMGRLCSELDSSQCERASLATTLQTTQQTVMDLSAQVETLTSQVETLKSQVEKYQDLFQSLWPTMSDEQQEHLKTILMDSE